MSADDKGTVRLVPRVDADRAEMLELLNELCAEIMRGEVTGLVVVIDRPKAVSVRIKGIHDGLRGLGCLEVARQELIHRAFVVKE